MTDHLLFPVWEKRLKSHGRTTFAPLPFYDSGRSIRYQGDGPSSWTTWIMVARTKAQRKWGTLRGGYVKQAWYGQNEFMGGKPLGLMSLVVQDYSRAGELVCDPCMGGGSAAIACIRNGRRFVGVERDPKAFAFTVDRVRKEADRVRGSLIRIAE